MLPNKNMYVQENSMEFQTLMLDEAENYNKVAANYPDEATDADCEMGDTHCR
jgi:hypothetical protein